jgi:hypothetical protein
MSGPVLPVTTFWRLAGMSYLQVYVFRNQSEIRSMQPELCQETKMSDVCVVGVDLDG